MLFFGNTRLGGKGHLEKGMVDVTLLLGKTRNVGEKKLYVCKRVEAFWKAKSKFGLKTSYKVYDKSLQHGTQGSNAIGQVPQGSPTSTTQKCTTLISLFLLIFPPHSTFNALTG